MATWKQIKQEAPDLAESAERLFAAQKHMTMATLRKDGSPRISATEMHLHDGDHYWLGSMPNALKARDLQRDARVAVHSPSVEPDDENPSAYPGDAKLSARAVEQTDPAVLKEHGLEGGGPHLFILDITELVVTQVGAPADHLLIRSWHEGRGFSEVKRR